MADSTHRVDVVPVVLKAHPNADSLSLVTVYGYTVAVRTADWQGVDCGAYIPPDSVVPETEAFAFLDGHRRIKVKRLRGVMSMGLLVPAPDGSEVGDDVAELLGVTHYEPPVRGSGTGGEAIAGPSGVVSYKYDIEAWRRYGQAAFVEGEPVVVTEKLHGANARYCFSAATQTMYCGSRTEWKREDAGNLWWRVLAATPSVGDWCRAHPDDVLYGEVYGAVHDLRYGHTSGGASFAAFDILRRGEWVDARDSLAELAEWAVPQVPVLYRGPYAAAVIEASADGPSAVAGADHVREGVVVKPEHERRDDLCGRVALKIVSNLYLERAA